MRWECMLIQGECIGCGICADLCQFDAIEMTREMAYPRPRVGKCTGCLVCAKQCPVAAIEVRELSLAGE